MKKKMALLLTAVLATSSVVAACGKDEGKKTTGEGKEKPNKNVPQVLNLPGSSEIPSMDSTKATDSVSFEVMNNVNEGLYRLGEDSKTPTPGVALDHKVNDDGTVYTFNLNPEAKWSNGDTVTAEDFVYSWRRAVDPKTAAEYAYIMSDVKNAAAISSGKEKDVTKLGIKAIDEKTLEVTLERAVPYFVELTSFATFYPLNQKFVESQGEKYGTEAETQLYNGPFALTEWKHETSYKLTKNANYWDAKTVKLEEINYKIVKDTATAVNLYKTGEVDRVGLSAEFVDEYKDKDENFSTAEDASVFFMRLNQANKALANKNIRLAMSKAIDKQSMVDTILNNGSKPADYLVPGNFVAGPDGKDYRETNGNFNSYNAEEAKAAFEAGLKELGTKKVEIELLNYDGDVSKRMGEYIQNQLETNLPGMKVKIKMVPFEQKLDLESKMNYDFTLAGWGPDYPDPMTFLDMFVTKGAHNQMNYSNPKFDKLINDAKTTLTTKPEERWAAMLEAEKVFFEDAALIPMYQRGAARLTQPYVKGIVDHQFGGDYSYKWTSIEK